MLSSWQISSGKNCHLRNKIDEKKTIRNKNSIVIPNLPLDLKIKVRKAVFSSA